MLKLVNLHTSTFMFEMPSGGFRSAGNQIFICISSLQLIWLKEKRIECTDT